MILYLKRCCRETTHDFYFIKPSTWTTAKIYLWKSGGSGSWMDFDSITGNLCKKNIDTDEYDCAIFGKGENSSGNYWIDSNYRTADQSLTGHAGYYYFQPYFFS